MLGIDTWGRPWRKHEIDSAPFSKPANKGRRCTEKGDGCCVRTQGLPLVTLGPGVGLDGMKVRGIRQPPFAIDQIDKHQVVARRRRMSGSPSSWPISWPRRSAGRDGPPRRWLDR